MALGLRQKKREEELRMPQLQPVGSVPAVAGLFGDQHRRGQVRIQYCHGGKSSETKKPGSI